MDFWHEIIITVIVIFFTKLLHVAFLVTIIIAFIQDLCFYFKAQHMLDVRLYLCLQITFSCSSYCEYKLHYGLFTLWSIVSETWKIFASFLRWGLLKYGSLIVLASSVAFLKILFTYVLY